MMQVSFGLTTLSQAYFSEREHNNASSVQTHNDSAVHSYIHYTPSTPPVY